MLRYAPAGDFMSVQGRMTLTPGPGVPTLSGALTAIENLRPAAQRDRSFRSGWPLHDLSVEGNAYLSPSSGAAQLAVALPGAASPLTLPFNLSANGSTTFPGSPPAPITKLTMKFTPATGVYTGTATLKDAVPGKPGTFMERTAPLHGVILGAGQTGEGLILVPDLPSGSTPANLTPIRAGAQGFIPGAVAP